MNTRGVQGKWQQIQGLAREWWAQWTDRNLYRASGKLEPFVDVLQTKFGYTREAAVEEFHRRQALFAAAKLKNRQNVV